MALTLAGRLKRDALRVSVFVHRWTGVAACVFFLVWFLTGAVMVFFPFPGLGKAQRLAGAETIAVSKLGLSPAQAFGAQASDLKSLKLVTVAGTPIYVGGSDAGPVVRSASTGALVASLSSDQAKTTAAAFGHAPALSVSGPLAYDQWIVNSSYNAGRPFYRVRLAGPSRTDLYVASRTGEIMQRTTATDRGAAWVGSIFHWAYFTVLAQHRQLWNQVCWWGSLFAFGVAILGMVLGIERYLAVRRAGRLSPFPQFWMRWHHITGLFAGALVLTWMGSGWLSNDNHRFFAASSATPARQALYDGRRDPAGWARLADSRFEAASEVTYVNVAGTAYLAGRGGTLAAPLVVRADTGETAGALSAAQIERAVGAAWPGAVSAGLLPANDFYGKAEGAPARTLAFDVPGRAALRVLVDHDTGLIVAVMDGSRRASAWLYYGLHTLQLPGLIGRETLRKTIECLLLLLGASVATTGLVLGVKRLGLTARDARVPTNVGPAAPRPDKI